MRCKPPCRSSARCLVKEAFKTWGDAVSEVREAVDFLRYYADEARAHHAAHQPCPVVA